MKANKKAILGMLVAMVMSLGVMNGINAKSNDSSLQQQVGAACLWYGSENGNSNMGWLGGMSGLGGAAAIALGSSGLGLCLIL